MNTFVRAAVTGAALAAVSLLAACGDDSDASGSDGGGLTITSPTDGAVVDASFEVTWDSDEELGEPDTGRDHVHVFVDGRSEDYTVVGGNEFRVEDLSPGEHTVNVTLQHADHSSAGQDDEIAVTVAPDAESSAPPEGEETSQPQDPGLGY